MSSESITLSKLTTEIASHLGKELDEPFKRILAQKVDSWRSRLLRNSLQEKPLESKFFRQTIYVKLEPSSQLPECLKGPLCKVLKSELPIPRPLRFSNYMFDYVGSIDGQNTFREKSPGTGQYLLAGKYSKKLVLWELKNDYLEVETTHVNSMPMLRIDGVFDKPSEVGDYNCATGVNCDFWDQPYPITGEIAQLVVQSILQTDFNRPQAPSDKEVDVNPQKQDHEPDGR